MKLRRKSPPQTGRNRVKPEEPPGRLAPSGYAYSSSRAETEVNTGRQQVRNIKQSTTYYLQRVGLIVLLLAVVASLTNLMTLSAHPKVLPLNSNSSPFLRSLDVYESAGGKLLGKSVWNRNKLTVDAGNISQQLVAQFPELADATMTIPLASHRPLIYIKPAAPVLILNARNGSFIVADTGKALLRADSAEELAQYKLPPVNDQSGLKLAVGHQALSGENVKFIQTIKTQLAAKGYTVESMTLPASSSQLEVRLSGQPYTVKFNLHSSKAREQAGTFLATIDYLKKHNQAPGQYVDVRVDGRAYYQ